MPRKSLQREQLTLDKIVALAAIIGLVISVIFSTINVMQLADNQAESSRLTSQSNNLTQQSLLISQQALELQNISSNFEPSIVPYIVHGDFGFYNYSGVKFDHSSFLSDGNLTVSLIVISPHACIVNFTDLIYDHDSMFLRRNDLIDVGNGTSMPILDPAHYLENSIIFDNQNLSRDFFSYPSGIDYQKYTAFAPAGVTQLNFTFRIDGFFTFNEAFFKATGRTDIFPTFVNLADMSFNVKILDVQTGKEYNPILKGTVSVWFIAVPPQGGWN